MGLTTLGEKRIRGDLIETFKMLTGKVDYGSNVFKLGRSGSNIVNWESHFFQTELGIIVIIYLRM